MDKTKWFIGSMRNSTSTPLFNGKDEKKIQRVNKRLRKHGAFINPRSLSCLSLPCDPSEPLDMTSEIMFFDVDKTLRCNGVKLDESLIIATDGLAMHKHGISASRLGEVIGVIVEELGKEGISVKKGMQVGTMDYEDGEITVMNLSIAFTVM